MSRWMRCFWDLKETNQGPWEETYIWESLGSTDETQISARSTELWLSWPGRRVSWRWCFNMKGQKDRKREGGGRQPRCRQRSKVQVLMCSRYDQGLASRPLPASESRPRWDTGVGSFTAWIPEAPNAWLKGRDAPQRQQGATKGATAWKRLNLRCNSENL